MEGDQLRCPICGEGHEGDNSGTCSSELIQNYVKGLGCYFPEEVFLEKEGVATTPCKDCSFYLKAVVSGMERVKGLTKDVAELERNFRKKLRELKSDGDNVVSQLKLIEESLNERKDGGSEVNQIENLQKGTEKACKSLAVAMGDVEAKLDWVKKWTNRNTAKIKTEVECSSAPEGNEETLQIVLVVSVPSTDTDAQHDCFEAGEVFQVKTEREDEVDTDLTGEPVLEGAVKLEREIVRETRQGPVYRSTEVTFPLDTLEIMRATENEKSAGEPMLIDLDEEETRSTDARNKSVSHSPPPSQDIHLEKNPGRNEVDEAESSEKLMHLEGEEDEEIPTVGIVAEEDSEQEDKDNFNIEASSSKILTEMETNHTENQKDTASLRKRSIAKVDGSPEKTCKVGVKKARRIPLSDVSVGGLPVAGNNVDPNDDNDENKNWFTEVTAQLRSKNEIALQKLLKPIPKLSPGLLHELMLQLKKENKLFLLRSIYFIEFVGDQRGKYPLFHEIFRTMNVEERTLAILSEANLYFNVLDSWKRNVLHSAIMGNQSISLLKSLIKRGANVKQVDFFGENLIHFAVKSGCTLETLEFLRNEGVKVENSKPPILMLQNVKDPERIFSLFKFLFNDGAHYPETVLPDYYKSKYEKILPHLRELLEFTISNGKIGWFSTKNSKGATPLHLALGCWRMDEENLQTLANAQVDFSIIDNERRGCLHYAISGGNWSPKTLRFLIDNGASAIGNKGDCETLLHIAAKNRAPWETFECLLEKGVKIGRKDSEGHTAMDLIIKRSRNASKDVMTKLFISTFDAGVRYSRYMTHRNPILHMGIKYGTLEVVEHMLENGADVNELDSLGETPFLKAINGNLPDGVEKAKLLRRFGANIPSEVEERKIVLHNIAKSATSELLKYCMEEFEVDVNATLGNGRTLLLTILSSRRSCNSKLSKAKMLILEGADVNTKPEAQEAVDHAIKLQCPLHLLVYQYKESINSLSFVDVLVLLLERGANINEKSLEGWTALHIVMENSSENSLELAKLLMQFGADIRAKTKKGQSVLHIAAGRRDIEKIQFCLSEGLNVNALDKNGKTPVEYLLPGDNLYFSDKSACQLENAMKVLLESGVTAKTIANVKKNIEKHLKGKLGSGVKSVLNNFLALLN